tara:strand:- start:34 stop:669 length:636 start_codon:yes stop_codon:yes gene_type:complete
MLNTKEQMDYLQSLVDSDTEDTFDNYPKRKSRAEEALIIAKKTERDGLDYFESSVNKDVYQSIAELTPAELKEQSIDTIKSIADITPIVGEIKAASELPNDLAYARELVELGYDEGDLRKMGLGGAYAMMSAMGIVPGIRVGAKAVKKSFKEIMDEELAKDVKPEPPKVDEPPKEILSSETTEEFLGKKREKTTNPETAKKQYGLMSKPDN